MRQTRNYMLFRSKNRRLMRSSCKWSFHLQKIVNFTIVFLFITLAGNLYAQDLPSLFQPSLSAGPGQATTQYAADRITVSPDFSLIDPAQSPVPEMTAALPDKTIVLRLDNIETRWANDYSWFGKVEGHDLSTVVLTVVDGIMQGYMNMEGESYSIAPDNGGYLIVKKDPAKAVPFDKGVFVPPPTSPGPASTQADTILADDGSVIDVLVLYTQEMQTHYGAGLNARIQLFVDLANTAYTNSGISTSLHLAHSALYTAAGAAEGVDIVSALSYVKADASIATLRNTYSADLVSLLRVYHDEGYCGYASIMTTVDHSFESFAFSVVESRSASEAFPPYYEYCDDTSFAHELGHNMGCEHDRIYADYPGAYPYSYGYSGVPASFLDSLPTDHPCYGSLSNPCKLRTDRQFGTIMSYIFPTIPYFSTPLVTYSGGAIGISGGPSGNDNPTSSADNARTINNTKVTVANFRVKDTTPPTAPITLSAAPATWSNSNSFTINWTNPSDPSGIAGAHYTIGASPTSNTDGSYTTSKPFTAGATAQGGQIIYVWLQDGAGNTSYSNNATTTLYYDGTAPGDGTITASQAGVQASLNWSGFTDAGGSGLKTTNTYKVVRSAGSNPPAQCTGGTQVYLGTGTSTTDASVANGLTYYYRACAYDNAGNVSAGALTSFILRYQLTTSIGSGSGSIAPDCSAGCWYNSGLSATLFAVPNSGQIFGSWGGDCSSTNPSTSVAMNGVKSCTANFTPCGDNPAKNESGPSTYTSIGNVTTGAYAAASNPDTIRLLATTLSETLNLNRAIAVKLSGGWDCGFVTQTSYSIIHGSLTIGKDSLAVTADRLILY